MLPLLRLKFFHCCEVPFIALRSPIITIILTMFHAHCRAITLKKREKNPPKAKEREEKVTKQIDVALGKVSFKDRDVSPIHNQNYLNEI
jgi:hypothetical protein